MLKGLFKKSDRTKVYLADWQVRLNGDRQCDNFIATYITTEEIFKNVNVGLELIFKDGRLEKSYLHEFGEKKERPLAKDENGLQLPSYPPNYLWQFIWDPHGVHQLGGDIPSNFQIPQSNGICPFQYLGYISNQDPVFDWLPFSIHLTCPIFLNIENIYLDYSNPNSPTIINKEAVDRFKSNYGDDLNKDSLVIFDEAKFSTKQEDEFSFEIGNAGIPAMIHETEIPICPVSGKRMRFLCELLGGVKVRHSNIKPTEEYYKKYFEELNFWGDGYLYVFFEPSAKTACYFIQNT